MLFQSTHIHLGYGLLIELLYTENALLFYIPLPSRKAY